MKKFKYMIFNFPPSKNDLANKQFQVGYGMRTEQEIRKKIDELEDVVKLTDDSDLKRRAYFARRALLWVLEIENEAW